MPFGAHVAAVVSMVVRIHGGMCPGAKSQTRRATDLLRSLLAARLARRLPATGYRQRSPFVPESASY
eukprot:6997079-Prymnesium_polylepis.2